MDSKLRKHALNLITNVLSSFQHQAATTSRVPANRNWATHRFLGGSSASGCYVEKSTHLSSAGEDAQKCPPSFPHLLALPLSLVSLYARWSGDEDQLTVRPSPPHGLLRTGGAAQQGQQTGFPHQPLVFSSSFSTSSSSSSFFCCTLLNAKHCWPFPPALLRFEHFDNPSQLSADRTNN